MVTVILALIGIAVFLFVAALIFSTDFRARVLQTGRIKSDQAFDAATKPIERVKDQHNQLVAKLPAQRAAVSQVMGRATTAHARLDQKIKDLDALKSQYAEAKGMNASEAALNALAGKFSQLQTEIDTARAQVVELDKNAVDARAALDETVKALQNDSSRIESLAAQSELTESIKLNTAAKQQAQDIQNSLSTTSDAAKHIEDQLAAARAASDLANGSATDQELVKIQEAAKAKKAREQLEAALGGTPASTTPATTK